MRFKVVPSAKIKRVYLLLAAKNRTEVEKAIVDYIGVLGWAKSSPMFIEGGKREGRIIFSIDRKEIHNIRAAFESSASQIQIVKISGTIKGLIGRALDKKI